MKDPQLPEAILDQREEAGGFDIREIWRIINKHKWSILALSLLVTIIGALFVYRQVPIYRATTTLLVERTPVQFSPVQDPYIAYTEHYLYYQTQYGLIKRRAIAERVVEMLDLGLPQPATPAKDQGFTWKSLLPDDWFPPPAQPTPEQQHQRAVSMVLGAINVDPRRNSQLVDVSAEHPDPAMAAEIANAVARAFIEDGLAGRLEMTEQATSFLTDKLVELRRKLETSQAALQAYRDQERIVDVRGTDGLMSQELSLATEKLAGARREESRISASYEQVRAAREDPSRDLSAIPAVYENPQMTQVTASLRSAERRVSELSNTYGPLHPQMIAANNELESARQAFNRQLDLVISAIENQYRSAQAAVAEASREFEAVKDRLRDLDRKEFNLQRLEREVETNQQIFEKFQTQFRETDAASGVQTANARIVEPARQPGGPVKPNKQRSISMAFFLGLVLSIGLAFLLEHLDNTLKGAEDVENRLQLPVLGLLPQLKTKDNQDLGPLRQFLDQPNSAFAEAIRTVRTGVLLSSLDDTHKVLLVTSSVPGEGKTTLSMNLARALSEMKSVLLIDADMRRPTVARAMGEKRNAKGLSHFISGEDELSQCVHKLDARLHVMPAGMVPPNPLELLSSARFADALDKLAERFDHIVIDCAPALAVSDAMVLSKLATAVVYVVRSDSTPVQAAQAGLKRLRRCGAHLIGAVVNRAARRSRVYYGKYSGYYGDSYYADYGYVSGKS